MANRLTAEEEWREKGKEGAEVWKGRDERISGGTKPHMAGEQQEREIEKGSSAESNMREERKKT